MKILLGSCGLVLLFGIFGAAKAQGYQGIVPLHSGCDEAKRAFKIAKCEPATAELENATVFINFSTGPCRPEWNVAAGTVLTLDVRPKKHLRLADLHIDETKYTQHVDPHTPNTIYWNSSSDGISIATFEDGRIRHIFYGPASTDEHLRCGSTIPSDRGGRGSEKFDQYGFIDFKEEATRLRQLAATLRNWPGARAYIIVYPSRATQLKEVLARAARAKTYLVKKEKVGTNRVFTMVGGYREEPSVELFITVQNGEPPIPSPPRRNEEDVKP